MSEPDYKIISVSGNALLELISEVVTREGMAVVDWQRSGPAPGQEHTGIINETSAGIAKITINRFTGDATLLYHMSEEAQEGRDAFREKRRPGFAGFPRRP